MNNFLPDIGKLHTYRTPQGYGVRVDDSFEAGMEIPIQYDPMIAKLITFGATRDEAIQRMKRAIADYTITGIETTLSFGAFAMNHEAYVKGDFDTKFIELYFNPEKLKNNRSDLHTAAAVSAGDLFFQYEGKEIQVVENPSSNWQLKRKS
jgi:acetyl/propionyl-CoA carboxylase alpha subunit